MQLLGNTKRENKLIKQTYTHIQGVIQVTCADQVDDEPELQRLRRIKQVYDEKIEKLLYMVLVLMINSCLQFQPLIKESERTFGLENLLGITIGLKGSSNINHNREDNGFEGKQKLHFIHSKRIYIDYNLS